MRLNRMLAIGVVLVVIGSAGYLLGITVAYPGRAFSVTAVMVGITLLTIGWAGDHFEVAG